MWPENSPVHIPVHLLVSLVDLPDRGILVSQESVLMLEMIGVRE